MMAEEKKDVESGCFVADENEDAAAHEDPEDNELHSDKVATQKQKRAGMIVLGSTCILSFLVSALLLGVVLPYTMDQDARGRYYISSGGAGALVWGLICLSFSCHAGATAAEPPMAMNKANTGELTFQIQQLEQVFGKMPSLFRQLEFMLVLARAAGNVGVLVLSAWRLPPRDPKVPWNLSRYCLAWFEVPVAGVLGICTIVYLFAFLCGFGRRIDSLHNFTSFVYKAGRFSALSFLPMANPMYLLKGMQNQRRQFILQVAREGDLLRASTSTNDLGKKMKTWQHVILLVRSITWFFFCLVVGAFTSVGAVLVKLSQVAFVAPRPWFEWTFYEYVAIASFINALTGLGVDINLVGQQKVVLDRYSARFDRGVNEVALHTWWKKRLLDGLLAAYSWRFTLVLATTLGLDDCIKLKRADDAPDTTAPAASSSPPPDVQGRSRSHAPIRDTE